MQNLKVQKYLEKNGTTAHTGAGSGKGGKSKGRERKRRKQKMKRRGKRKKKVHKVNRYLGAGKKYKRKQRAGIHGARS